MDSSAVLWILTWSGVVSITIFVLTGILGQLLPLVEAWRRLIGAFRGDNTQGASDCSEPTTGQENTVPSVADPVQLEAAGSATGGEQCEELDSAASAPPSHQ
ncbi:hypothetical protein AB0H82_26270 [Streptomyces sp. NPDC050732]|uniref:hypothetical protein n=1 Tax=Streptomyces sp. NPDC050732 TaxID=3154632 RepID=UPI00343AFBE5